MSRRPLYSGANDACHWGDQPGPERPAAVPYLRVRESWGEKVGEENQGQNNRKPGEEEEKKLGKRGEKKMGPLLTESHSLRYDLHRIAQNKPYNTNHRRRRGIEHESSSNIRIPFI